MNTNTRYLLLAFAALCGAFALWAVFAPGPGFDLPELADPELAEVDRRAREYPSLLARTQTECGNGKVEEGEQCDDGNAIDGDGCTKTCTKQVCGNGAVEAGEECDDGNNEDGDACSADCLLSDCKACKELNCESWPPTNPKNRIDECFGATDIAAGGPKAGTPRAELCKEVVECHQEAGCLSKLQYGLKCYCGSVPSKECVVDGGNGPCVKEWEAAAESTDPVTVGARFTNPSFALGRAGALAMCEVHKCENACKKPKVAAN